MIVIDLTMRGPALQWWLWWSPRHLRSSRDTFTTALLWRFKPEWRHLLPILDEEIEPTSESLKSEEATPFVENSVADPTPIVVGDGRNLTSDRIRTPEKMQLDSCLTFPQGTITSDYVSVVAETQLKDGGYNDDTNFTIPPKPPYPTPSESTCVLLSKPPNLLIAPSPALPPAPSKLLPLPKPSDLRWPPPPPTKPPDGSVVTGTDSLSDFVTSGLLK